MLRMAILSLAISILFGCGSGSDDSFSCDSGDEELVGCWLTECGQLVNRNEEPVSVWTTNEISFRANGEMQILFNVYEDAECSGSPIDTHLLSEEADARLEYFIGRQVSDSNGLDAKQIQILDITADNTVDALYYITSDQMLCTSTNLVIGYRSFTLTLSDGAYDAVDLTRCIARVE